MKNIINKFRKLPRLPFSGFSIEISRLRMRMLSWLALPLILVIVVGAQIFHMTDLFGNTTKVASASNEAETATKLPPIPDFKYENTGLVTLWFDDGWKSQYDVALPLLDKYGYKGALAVPTSVIGSYNYMSWLQVKRLQHKGWEINAHSRTHNCDMENAKEAQVNFEVVGSLQDLKKREIRHDIYVTPCGVENPLIEQTVKLNYPVALRTSNPGLNTLPVPDRYDLVVMAVRNTTTKKDVEKWLEQAKREKKWIILMFHRVDLKDQEYNTDQKTFEEVIEAVHASGLPVVLPTQVLSLKGTGSQSGPLPADKLSVDQNLIPLESSEPEQFIEESSSGEPETVGSEGEVGENPEASESGEPSESPEPSETPEPSISPEPSETPDPSESPEPEGSAEPSSLPVVIPTI